LKLTVSTFFVIMSAKYRKLKEPGRIFSPARFIQITPGYALTPFLVVDGDPATDVQEIPGKLGGCQIFVHTTM
jgi:hypothetical protein